MWSEWNMKPKSQISHFLCLKFMKKQTDIFTETYQCLKEMLSKHTNQSFVLMKALHIQSVTWFHVLVIHKMQYHQHLFTVRIFDNIMMIQVYICFHVTHCTCTVTILKTQTKVYIYLHLLLYSVVFVCSLQNQYVANFLKKTKWQYYGLLNI